MREVEKVGVREVHRNVFPGKIMQATGDINGIQYKLVVSITARHHSFSFIVGWHSEP